jgi:hypothetical protein
LRQKVLKLLGDQTAATPPSAIQKRSIIRRVEFTRPLEILSSIAAAAAVLAGLRILSTLTEKKADADAFINMAVAMRQRQLADSIPGIKTASPPELSRWFAKENAIRSAPLGPSTWIGSTLASSPYSKAGCLALGVWTPPMLLMMSRTN